jgi:hypothetical protein
MQYAASIRTITCALIFVPSAGSFHPWVALELAVLACYARLALQPKLQNKTFLAISGTLRPLRFKDEVHSSSVPKKDKKQKKQHGDEITCTYNMY